MILMTPAGVGLEARTTADSREAHAVFLDTSERFPLDDRPVDRANTHGLNSYSNMLDAVTPAVVSVTTSRIVRVMRNRSIDPREEFLRRFFGLPNQRPTTPYDSEGEVEEHKLPNGLGSGVIVSPDGYILTNNHVVTDPNGNTADEIVVTLQDEREVTAELIGNDPKTDVAVLKIDLDNLSYVKMADSNNLRVGDIVFAIGNPLGVGQTVTMGIVSATGRSNLGLLGQQGYENFIQTDASINPGNSGGPLVDTEGRLIGINAAILSRTGGNIGIGFAIPIRLARTIMTDLIETGAVQRGFLGVAIGDVTEDIMEAFELESTGGALVQRAEEGLPAARAGIERGDVIISIDGQPVRDSNELRLIVAQMHPGRETMVTIIRKGKPREIKVVLGDLENPYSLVAGSGEVLEGVSISSLDAQSRQQLGISTEVQGLLITGVERSSPHVRSLTEGMVILEANDEPVRSPDDLSRQLRQGINTLYLYYNNSYGFTVIRIN